MTFYRNIANSATKKTDDYIIQSLFIILCV